MSQGVEKAPLNSCNQKRKEKRIKLYDTYPEEALSVSSRGHKWTLVTPRERSGIRANTAIRREVEEGVVIVILTFLAWPAFICIIACALGRTNVNIDDAIKEFARGILDCPVNSPTVTLPGIPRSEFALLLSGAYSRAYFHS